MRIPNEVFRLTIACLDVERASKNWRIDDFCHKNEYIITVMTDIVNKNWYFLMQKSLLTFYFMELILSILVQN